MSTAHKPEDLSPPVKGKLSGEKRDHETCWNIAAETPLVLFYNGKRFGVMMATPADLEDFATGFSLSEGIIGNAGEIEEVRQKPLGNGIALNIIVPQSALERVPGRQRALSGASSCGICGTDSIELALPRPPRTNGFVPETKTALKALEALGDQQVMNRQNFSCHGAGLADHTGKIILVREDIGRHNALDKLLGAMARAGLRGENGFGVLTSRFSVEMAQKAAMAGFSFVATLSAPTTLALETARKANMKVGTRAGNRLMVFE